MQSEFNNSEKLLKKRKKYGLPSNPKDPEFFQSLKDYCTKLEIQSLNLNLVDPNKGKNEKMELEYENDEENDNKGLSFKNDKIFSSFASNGLFQDKEKSNKGLKKIEKIEMEKDDYKYENYNFLNFDKASLSGGEQEEGVEVFIDSKNNRTYKFVDDMTFECDEI